MGMSDRWFDSVDNNKLIGQLHFEGPPTIIVKIYGGVTGSYSRGVVEVRMGCGLLEACVGVAGSYNRGLV